MPRNGEKCEWSGRQNSFDYVQIAKEEHHYCLYALKDRYQICNATIFCSYYIELFSSAPIGYHSVTLSRMQSSQLFIEMSSVDNISL